MVSAALTKFQRDPNTYKFITTLSIIPDEQLVEIDNFLMSKGIDIDKASKASVYLQGYDRVVETVNAYEQKGFLQALVEDPKRINSIESIERLNLLLEKGESIFNSKGKYINAIFSKTEFAKKYPHLVGVQEQVANDEPLTPILEEVTDDNIYFQAEQAEEQPLETSNDSYQPEVGVVVNEINNEPLSSVVEESYVAPAEPNDENNQPLDTTYDSYQSENSAVVEQPLINTAEIDEYINENNEEKEDEPLPLETNVENTETVTSPIDPSVFEEKSSEITVDQQEGPKEDPVDAFITKVMNSSQEVEITNESWSRYQSLQSKIEKIGKKTNLDSNESLDYKIPGEVNEYLLKLVLGCEQVRSELSDEEQIEFDKRIVYRLMTYGKQLDELKNKILINNINEEFRNNILSLSLMR